MSSVTSRGSESLARRLVAGPALVLARRWHLIALLVFFLVTCLMLAPVLHGKTLSEVSSVQSWEYPWAGSATATHGTEPMIMHWDQLDSFYPWQVYMSRALHAGALPLWNPYEFGGVPFFANGQSGVLYPPRLALSLTVSPVRVHDLLALSHMLGAGVAMYLMLVYFRRSWFASVLGGIAWMSSSFLLAWLALEHFLIVAVWLPVAMGLVDYAIRRRSVPAAIALAFTLTMLFLGGNALFVELAFVTILAFGVVTICGEVIAARSRGSAQPYRSLWWGAALLGGAFIATAGLSAVQLLPNLELLARTSRAGLTYAVSASYALPSRYLRDIFLPPVLDPAPASLVDTVYHNALFVGTPTALLALVGLTTRSRVSAFAGVLAVTVVAFMLRTPLNELLYAAIPGLDSLKPLARASFLLCFAIAVLGAFGLDRASRLITTRWPSTRVLASVVLVACACIAIVLWQAKGLAREDVRAQEPTPAAVYPGTPLTDRLASLGEPRILPLVRVLRGSTPMVEQITSAAGYESLLPERVERFWEVVGGTPPAVAARSSLESAFDPQYESDSVRYDLLARAGVSFVAAIPGTNLPPARSAVWHRMATPSIAYDGTDGRLFQLKGAPGLTSIVDSCTSVPSEDAAFRAFTDSRFAAERTLLLEQPVKTLARYCSGRPTSNSRSRIDSTGINSYTGSATLDRPGMLLIRVSSYPGWHAKVDGKSAKLITADYMFQAVPLAAGTHRITLTFAPRSLRVGEIVSLATLALLLAVLGVQLGRTYRRRHR